MFRCADPESGRHAILTAIEYARAEVRMATDREAHWKLKLREFDEAHARGAAD